MTGSRMKGVSRHRWRIAAWGMGAGLILLPLVAMQFTDEVDWNLADFIFAGALVTGTGLAFEVAVRLSDNAACRAAFAVALFAAFILIWANLAVGIIGSEDNPANRMYWGVLAVGITGAAFARLRARGMAYVMAATAFAQVLAAVTALVMGWGFTGPVTVFFAALWLAAAWLFRKAAREGQR